MKVQRKRQIYTELKEEREIKKEIKTEKGKSTISRTIHFHEDLKKQADIMEQIIRASCAAVASNTNATREDGCALSRISDLLCYVREHRVQNCLYGNDWKQKKMKLIPVYMALML